jgi:hypothetical protein
VRGVWVVTAIRELPKIQQLLAVEKRETRPLLAKSPRPVFARRQNSDGSFQSICGRCFARVASGKNEADLEPAEAAHICSGFDLGGLLHPTEKKERPRKLRLRAA